MSTKDGDKLIDHRGVSDVTGLSEKTIRNMRSDGRFPVPAIKYGTAQQSRVRFRLADVLAWRDGHLVEEVDR